MRPPARLPAGLESTFGVRAAARAGVNPGRLRRADLESPLRGVRSRGGERPTLLELCRALAGQLPPDTRFTHTTAAILHGLPVPPSSSRGGVHVSVPRGRRASRLQGTVGHHLLFRSTDLMDAFGIRTTTPERTWCDLATILGLEDLVAAGDHLLASGTPQGLLSEVVEGYPGRRGSRLRREALGLLDAGAESPPESIIRVRVILAGLPRPVSNFVVRDRAGRFVARVDLAYPRFRMAIEYEGDHHRSDPQQWARDLARVPHLEDLGWHTTRCGRADLADSRRLVGVIRRRLLERGWSGDLDATHL